MSIDLSDLVNPEPPAFSRVSAQLELQTVLHTAIRDDWNGRAAAPVRNVFEQFGVQALHSRHAADGAEATQFLAVRVPDGSMDGFIQAIGQVPGVVAAAPVQLARLM